MATILSFITWKPTRLVLWIIISAFFLNQVLFPLIISNSLHLWTLIKHRKFIYIILNIIIISILISSSTSFTPFFTTIFLKLHKSFKNSSLEYHHDDHHQSTHKVIFPPVVDDHDDHDSWWSLSLSQMGHEPGPIPGPEVQETAPFRVPEADRQSDSSADKISVNDDDILEEKAIKKTGEGEGEDDEDDSLDATWRAIMEAKGKESGPHLKKSDTWTAGDERRKESRGGVLEGLSKYKVTVELKKWQSFRDMIEGKEFFGGGGGGGGCGGGRGGGGGGGGGQRAWRSVDMALTFHDELKKRADAFIARVTHDIRLQRLESEQRFLEMINRGL